MNFFTHSLPRQGASNHNANVETQGPLGTRRFTSVKRERGSRRPKLQGRFFARIENDVQRVSFNEPSTCGDRLPRLSGQEWARDRLLPKPSEETAPPPWAGPTLVIPNYDRGKPTESPCQCRLLFLPSSQLELY